MCFCHLLLVNSCSAMTECCHFPLSFDNLSVWGKIHNFTPISCLSNCIVVYLQFVLLCYFMSHIFNNNALNLLISTSTFLTCTFKATFVFDGYFIRAFNYCIADYAFVEFWLFIECDVNLRLPSKKDVAGAAWGIIRLQEVYSLSTADVISGNIPNNIYSIPVTGDFNIIE